MLVTQSCLTLCSPMDYSSPGSSSVHGILQARILKWVACPPPGALPNPGIEPRSPALQADSLLSEPPGKPWVCCFYSVKYFVHIPLFSKTMKESKPSISHHYSTFHHFCKATDLNWNIFIFGEQDLDICFCFSNIRKVIQTGWNIYSCLVYNIIRENRNRSHLRSMKLNVGGSLFKKN